MAQKRRRHGKRSDNQSERGKMDKMDRGWSLAACALHEFSP
jgi:hypothetical protein